jgi:hypothetical protein
MSELKEQQKPQITEEDLTMKEAKKEYKQTFGMKVFDVALFSLNNILVFAMSVYLTILTDSPPNKAKNWFERKMKQRGDLVENFLHEKFNFSKDSANVGKMVFWSFADGTIILPILKLIEDRKAQISRGIDTMFGKTPEDDSVYDAEPKKSWKSFLIGRALVAGIVVPTAVVLDRYKPKATVVDKEGNIQKDQNGKRIKANQKFNDVLFHNNGALIGKKMSESDRPFAKWVTSIVGKDNMATLFRTSAFEAFYTTVCTVGLYFASRFIARKDDKKREAKEKKQADRIQKAASNQTVLAQEEAQEHAENKDEKSSTKGNKRYSDQHTKSSSAQDYVSTEQSSETILSTFGM